MTRSFQVLSCLEQIKNDASRTKYRPHNLSHSCSTSNLFVNGTAIAGPNYHVRKISGPNYSQADVTYVSHEKNIPVGWFVVCFVALMGWLVV